MKALVRLIVVYTVCSLSFYCFYASVCFLLFFFFVVFFMAGLGMTIGAKYLKKKIYELPE